MVRRSRKRSRTRRRRRSRSGGSSCAAMRKTYTPRRYGLCEKTHTSPQSFPAAAAADKFILKLTKNKIIYKKKKINKKYKYCLYD